MQFKGLGVPNKCFATQNEQMYIHNIVNSRYRSWKPPIITTNLTLDEIRHPQDTAHATASVLMDTYAHTQDKPRLELTEKIEANFYSQDLTPATPQPQQNEKPVATKITGREILEAIRLMDADERRELTRALFA